jgi:hypothetical protein
MFTARAAELSDIREILSEFSPPGKRANSDSAALANPQAIRVEYSKSIYTLHYPNARHIPSKTLEFHIFPKIFTKIITIFLDKYIKQSIMSLFSIQNHQAGDTEIRAAVTCFVWLCR